MSTTQTTQVVSSSNTSAKARQLNDEPSIGRLVGSRGEARQKAVDFCMNDPYLNQQMAKHGHKNSLIQIKEPVLATQISSNTANSKQLKEKKQVVRNILDDE